MVAAMGRLSRGSYTAKDGAQREQWSLLADAVVTARSARPIGPRRDSVTRAAPRDPQTPDFDTRIPF
jgi:single-strand DNA-binding protein